MLAIRMQRTGRRGHAQFRVIVQDSRFSPTSGRVVAYLGSYNPHTKQAQLDSETAAKFLANGAQPSNRVIRLFKQEKIKLPDWVKESAPRERAIRNPEKLRRNRPDEPEAAAPAPETVEAAPETSEAPAKTTEPTEATIETPAETEALAEEVVEAEVPVEPEASADEPVTETAETPAEPEA